MPERLLLVRFSRSGGPGGQNVNKVETRVDLRLDLQGVQEILGKVRVDLIRESLMNRLDSNGNLRVENSETRSRAQNMERALLRIEGLVNQALVQQRKRKPTKPSRASQRRRVEDKKRRGEQKRLRQKVL